MENKSNLDEQMYSRQIVLLGLETMEKISKLSILIIGQRGLGVEIAKNIIVSGPFKVSIFDPSPVEISDTGSNFYLKEEDIGKRRDLASLNNLIELNEYVNVDYIKKKNIKEIYNDIPNNFNVVVVTEIFPLDEIIEINNICRKNNIKFIYSAICGLISFVFDDFGDEHIIFDEYCEKVNKFKIKNIQKTVDGSGLVEIQLVKEGVKPLIGDSVIFKEVEGMTEINYEKCHKIWEIKKTDSNNIFMIDNISKFSDYTFGGYLEERPIPKKMKYSSLSKKLEIPFTQEEDEFLKWKQKLIFIIFKSLMIFKQEKKILPKKGNQEHLNEMTKLVDKELQFYKSNKNEKIFNNIKLDENIIKNICETAKAEICCMTSLIGGIVCQEIIKSTGKYIPINQWQIFNFLEYLPMDSLRNRNENLPINRYTEQTAIFGEKIINELQNQKILLAGAGAVGCEMLKNLSLFGIGSKKDIPHITVVDFDKIELSNLNRQFLFLKKSIGKFKVEEAAISAENMNKEVKILPIPEKFDKENDKLFNNKFFKEKDVILISIDTNSGKEYLDKKSVLLNKPMILGAILGPQAKSETYVPFETASYGDLSLKITNNNTEKITPSCTIRYFPKRIEDCIEWARNYFNDLFIEPIIKLKKLIKENNYFECLKNEISEKNNVITLVNFLKLINENSIESMLEYCLKIFLENYTLWEKKF